MLGMTVCIVLLNIITMLLIVFTVSSPCCWGSSLYRWQSSLCGWKSSLGCWTSSLYRWTSSMLKIFTINWMNGFIKYMSVLIMLWNVFTVLLNITALFTMLLLPLPFIPFNIKIKVICRFPYMVFITDMFEISCLSRVTWFPSALVTTRGYGLCFGFAFVLLSQWFFCTISFRHGIAQFEEFLC